MSIWQEEPMASADGVASARPPAPPFAWLFLGKVVLLFVTILVVWIIYAYLHAFRLDWLGWFYSKLLPLTNGLYALVETYFPSRRQIQGARRHHRRSRPALDLPPSPDGHRGADALQSVQAAEDPSRCVEAAPRARAGARSHRELIHASHEGVVEGKRLAIRKGKALLRHRAVRRRPGRRRRGFGRRTWPGRAWRRHAGPGCRHCRLG